MHVSRKQHLLRCAKNTIPKPLNIVLLICIKFLIIFLVFLPMFQTIFRIFGDTLFTQSQCYGMLVFYLYKYTGLIYLVPSSNPNLIRHYMFSEQTAVATCKWPHTLKCTCYLFLTFKCDDPQGKYVLVFFNWVITPKQL